MILHEYGHAIHSSQNFSFASEQAGAISEGFGDYWALTKPCEPVTKSHISHVVADSKLEVSIAHVLEEMSAVESFAKNDRLFLEIPYRYLGSSLRYRPDFIVKLKNGRMLLIEGKGRRDEKDDAKSTAAKRWVAAVNAWGKLGSWSHHVCFSAEEARQAADDEAA